MGRGGPSNVAAGRLPEVILEVFLFGSLLGTRGAPGAVQEASGGHFGMMFGLLGHYLRFFRIPKIKGS